MGIVYTMLPKALENSCRNFSLAFYSLLLVHCTAIRHPLPHVAEDLAPLVARQQPSTIAIAGVTASFGVYNRLEIRQLQQNTDQWNLYLLGLKKMQAVNQSDPLSWYQIAGMGYVPSFSMLTELNRLTHVEQVFMDYLTYRGTTSKPHRARAATATARIVPRSF